MDERTRAMGHIRCFDHIGIAVADLDAVTDSFVALAQRLG